MSNLHRVCCGVLTDPPRLVKAGWYHFLVMSECGNLTLYIGTPQQTTVGETCRYETIPSEPTGGHPLTIPAAVTAKPAKDIECGAYHCVVRHKDNTISCWGLNGMGQCDVPSASSKGDLTDPNNPNLKKIVGLHAGYSTTAVTFADGSVVCWGDPEVAEIVNSAVWQNILMTPPLPSHEPHTAQQPDVGSVDAVDPSAPQYYKGQLAGAYSTDESNTYNVATDHFQEWHAGQTPALPMFSLGVETDPHLPMELDPVGESGYGHPLPSIHWVKDAVTTPPLSSNNADRPGVPLGAQQTPQDEPFFEPPCSCVGENDQPLTQDEVEACWRDYMFNLPHYGEGFEKSCCDLQIKKDFAVAILRTGRIVTSRQTNTYTSNPNPCPTDTYCRDCSADRYLAQINAGPNQGAPINGQCDCPGDYRFIYQRNGSTLEQCELSDINPSVGNTFGFPLEGIGCVGARPGHDQKGYDPNWAKAANGLAGRWTSAEQVRAGNPVWNDGALKYGWGNSRQQLSDQLTSPPNDGGADCVIWHAQETDCDGLCSSGNGYDENGSLNDSNVETKYQYPRQFWTQQLECGTNTSFWNIQPPAWEKNSPMFGNCNPNGPPFNKMCVNCGDANRHCGELQQYTVPNGGFLSYGCIYSVDLDKYGYDNSWRSQTLEFSFDPDGLCAGGPAIAATNYARSGSRPWGPWQIVIRNGIGDAWNRKGSTCHWCYCQGTNAAGQLVPGAGHPVVIAPGSNDGFNNAISFDITAQLDHILGTHNGFPWEGNLQPSFPEYYWANNHPAVGNWLRRQDCANRFNQICQCDAAGNYSPTGHDACTAGEGPWKINFGSGSSWLAGFSFYGTPFGLYHHPRSVASSRMAFAMIRADHRVLDPETGERVEKTDTTIDWPGPVIDGVNDPTQYEVCDVSQPGAECLPDVPNDQYCGPGTDYPDCPESCDPFDDSMAQRCVNRRTDMILMIWGSLWDPCPPWPRQCEADCYSELGEGEVPDPGQAQCCDPAQQNPEAPNYCCEEPPCDCDSTYCCDPATDASCECNPEINGPCLPPYPCWTRVPEHVRIGDEGDVQNNVVRTSANAGQWVKVDGVNVRQFPNLVTPSYPPMPILPKELCIDCSDGENACGRVKTFLHQASNMSSTLISRASDEFNLP